MLKAARALFAHIFARAKIHNNTGALPQPPSGEQCSPEPQRAAEYVRAIGAFAKSNFHAKVFSLTPLTQYILDPFGLINAKIKLFAKTAQYRTQIFTLLRVFPLKFLIRTLRGDQSCATMRRTQQDNQSE